MPTIEEIADAMYKMIKDAEGQKKLKPTDLIKAVADAYGTDKKTSKLAIRSLVDSGRLVYTYFGGSYLEIPSAGD
ncbi:hypothetical protein AMJ80_11990 [bacterium SM23_31]|nr:MAG: hypothetical protein AMJ80_11990 [bacterium SM23_31]